MLKYFKSLWSFNPIPRGCVLYLPLWSSGLRGSAFKSIDPYGHTCTVVGATKVANGYSFDGTDDKIACGNHPAFAFEYNSPFTLECIINTSTSPAQSLISKYDGPTGFYTRLTGANLIEFALIGAGAGTRAFITSTTTTIADGVDHYITFTHSGSGVVAGMAIFVDGVEETSYTINDDDLGTNSMLNNAELQIGERGDGSQDYTGIIRMARVYDRQLSSAEAIYNAVRTKDRWA